MATKKASQPKVTDDSVSIADTPPPKKTKGGKTFALTPDNLFDQYEAADSYTTILNAPFDEFQRISRNKPFAGLAKKFPKVAEGSSSAYIQQKPRQLIQQTPSGDVTAEDVLDAKGNALGVPTEWMSLVAQDILDNEMIPNANEDYPVFEKAQNAMEQAFMCGFTVTTAPFYNHDGVWSSDMTMAFWGDVKVPAGYKSIRPMPYTFIDGWWPKERVDALINDPNAAIGGWDIKALKQAQTTLSNKGERQLTPAEKSRGLPQDYFRVTVAKQKGVKSPQYTFNPDTKSILRTEENPDPRGQKNIQVLYGLVDGTNPFGMSVLELAGAWQNLMDNDVQAFQYAHAYNVDPAVKRIGNIGDGEIAPGASFDAQTADDDIVTIPLTTQDLSNFPSIHEWQRSVLMSLLNSPTSAAGAEGESPLGKTPKGITTAASLISTDDNTFVVHAHDWFQDWAETGLNITFAKRKGKQALTLSDQTVDQLKALAESDPTKFDVKLLKGNILMFDFDQPLPIFRFKVDAASSKLEDEASQLQALDGALQRVEGSPILQELIGADKIAEVWNKMISLSGIHDSSDLELDVASIKQQIEQQQQTAQAEDDATQENRLAQTAKAPNLSIAFKDLGALPTPARVKAQLEALKSYGITTVTDQDLQDTTPDAAAQAAGTKKTPPVQPPSAPPPEMLQAIATLQKAGIPEVMIPKAIQALTEGVPLQDVLTSPQEPEIAAIKTKVGK